MRQLDICCRNKKWHGDDVSFVILQSVSVTNIKNGCHKQQCPYYWRLSYRPEFIPNRGPYVTFFQCFPSIINRHSSLITMTRLGSGFREIMVPFSAEVIEVLFTKASRSNLKPIKTSMQRVQGKNGRGVNLITHLPLRLIWKNSGVMSLLHIRPYNMQRDKFLNIRVQRIYFVRNQKEAETRN